MGGNSTRILSDDAKLKTVSTIFDAKAKGQILSQRTLYFKLPGTELHLPG